MNNIRKIMIWATAMLLFQGMIYLYLDRVLLAPASSFQISQANAETVTSGKAYYSKKRNYMAVIKTGVLEIYGSDNKLVRKIEIGKRRVSYFKWLDDRNLALMGLDYHTSSGTSVSLSRIDPNSEGQEVSATIKNLPADSTLVDVAYSTATNVVYMQVLVEKNPNYYRVYRTDANHDLQRSYLTTTRIGRIATLFDFDYLIYDDLTDGAVIAKYTDGSWAVISPPIGKYRLIGTEGNDIYIARMNSADLATAVYKGGVKTKFAVYKKLTIPTDIHQLTVSEAAKPDVDR